jgi:hypothetical protein
MNGLKYEELCSSESFGSSGGFGIKILIATTRRPDLTTREIKTAARKAVDLISSEIQAQIIAEDPVQRTRADLEKEGLLNTFPENIFVEEIPNGYCSDWCCRHLPWFIVTTKIGRFKIGWRKRVIQIDWSDTVGTKSAEELFPDESVTKRDKMIHAWGIDDAGRYVAEIMHNLEG